MLSECEKGEPHQRSKILNEIVLHYFRFQRLRSRPHRSLILVPADIARNSCMIPAKKLKILKAETIVDRALAYIIGSNCNKQSKKAGYLKSTRCGATMQVLQYRK